MKGLWEALISSILRDAPCALLRQKEAIAYRTCRCDGMRTLDPNSRAPMLRCMISRFLFPARSGIHSPSASMAQFVLGHRSRSLGSLPDRRRGKAEYQSDDSIN